jgi:cellulose synthase/poly-beta-1,6-N-acetylglucosamine synthase-like glycosyltransferase
MDLKNTLEICFWLAAGCIAYTYAGYPILVAVMGRCRNRPVKRIGPGPQSFSIILAAHNEEAAIERRLDELANLIATSGLAGEIIVVSDGSTDSTVARARNFARGQVRVVEISDNIGKAAALSQGCKLAVNEVLVFADCRQSWSPDALHFLLDNFRDPQVGAASGDLVIEKTPGVLAGVRRYWLYEKGIRRRESRIHSTVGVTGAISAVRRELFRPIPAGTLLDDVYWPMRVVLQGFRVVHDHRARAYDRLPPRSRDEFRRKVRTLSGNFQLMVRLPAALLPWRNPVWAQYVSHKVLRLFVPWMLLTLLLCSAFLPSTFFQFVFLSQVGFYTLGVTALVAPGGWQPRLLSLPGCFLTLNAAAWLAFWVWVSGRAGRTWKRVTYPVPAGA